MRAVTRCYYLRTLEKNVKVNVSVKLKRVISHNVNVNLVEVSLKSKYYSFKKKLYVTTPSNHSLKAMITESDLDTIFNDIVNFVSTVSSKETFFTKNNLFKAQKEGILDKETCDEFYNESLSLFNCLKRVCGNHCPTSIKSRLYINDCVSFNTIVAWFASSSAHRGKTWVITPNRETADDILHSTYMKNTHKLVDSYPLNICMFNNVDKINKINILL